ncbi:MAG: hypothetical protein AAF919_05575 [Pseudomonadota bacterium]
MITNALIQTVTDHIKVYLVAGTLAAIGFDVMSNVSAEMVPPIAGIMGDAMLTMPMMDGLTVPGPVALLVQGIGASILAIGLILYGANMWCGFRALRQFRFRFKERGPVLKTCGWSAAFLYVVGSVAIGLSVNAVYLTLVG